MKSVFKKISSPILSSDDESSTNSKKNSLFSMNRARTISNDLLNRFTEDEDDISDLESLANYTGEDQQQHSRGDLGLSDADSLIGGSNVNYIDHDDDETDNNITNDHRGDQNHKQIRMTQQPVEKSHKIFSFQLPFGGGLSLPRRVKIPFITSSNYQLDEDIRLKLQRNESISTLEEAKIFANFKGVDNGRLRAVKKALTPSIASEIKTYITNVARPDYETIYDDLEGDVVILGGYRGSILRDCKTLKRVWIPIKAGFGMRKIDLYIGPTEQDELDQEHIIKPDGMLTHIGPVDISKKLIKKLRMNPNVRVHEFGYDWRLSGHINSAKLEAKLLELYKKNNGKKTYVIAHSMGGLIAHHVLNKNPELIRGIIYVGVPSECPNVLGPIRFGDDVLFSDKILTAEVNFMMRSSFLFLPLSGELFVDKHTLQKVNLDYFDVNTWINYNLSPLVGLNRLKFEKDLREGKIKSLEMYDKHGGTVNTYNNLEVPVIVENLTNFRTSYEDSVAYLDRTLKQTKKFLKELEFDPTKKYPPSVVIYGNNIPSLRGSFITNGEEDIKLGNWFDFFYGPGDGVVNQHWIMPEKRGFPIVEKFPSSTGHVALMTELDNVGKLLRSLVNEEIRRKNNHHHHQQHTHSDDEKTL